MRKYILFLILGILLLFAYSSDANFAAGKILKVMIHKAGDILDIEEGSAGVMNHEHRKIHEGEHYNCGSLYNVGAGDSSIWMIDTTQGRNQEYHFTFQVGSSNYAVANLYRGVTFTSTGTAKIQCNNNQYGYTGIESGLVIGENAVILSSGTLINAYILGTNTASPHGDQGGLNKRNFEVILSTIEMYAITVTVLNANTDTTISTNYYTEEPH